MNIYTIINKLHAHQKSGQNSKFMQGFPFFYGWVIFAASTFGQIMLSPGLTFAVSQFIDHFIGELNITRTLVSTLYTAATILGSFSLPIVGRLVDRHGPRLMGTVISLLFGLATIFMGLVKNPAMLFAGFVALRLLGQCSMGLVCTNVVNLWWVRRRGAILGLSGFIIGIGGFGIFPNLIQYLIGLRDWRFAYFLMGTVITVVLVPVVAVFFRNRPEDYGLQPDGIAEIPAGKNTIQVNLPLEENWTLAAAMRTPVFWIISFCVAIISLLISGLFFHLVSIFEDHQLPAAVAASAYIPVALASAIFNLVSGILVDRVAIKHMLALSQITLISCMLLALNLSGVVMAYLLGAMIGACLGLAGTIASVSFAKYYGRVHLGAISGAAGIIGIIGSAIGPLPLAIARDSLGSYDQVLAWSITVPLILLIASLFARPPVMRTQVTQ